MHLLILKFTFLSWRWEKLHFGSETGKEVLQEEQRILQTHKNKAVIPKTWLRGFIRVFDTIGRKTAFNLINIKAKGHQRNTQTALLGSLACLRTHVQCLNCQLRAKTHEWVAVGQHLTGLLWAGCRPHHVRMSFSRHFLARIQVEELVHLWGSQSVSNLQVLHNKHLPGDWLIHCWPRSHLGLRVHIMLKPHLVGKRLNKSF